MINKIKEKLVGSKNYALCAFATGLMFISETMTAHASLGDQLTKPVNSAGSELDSALFPIAILVVVIIGVLLLVGKKKLASSILITAIGAYFLIKNRNTIANIFNSWF